MSNSSQATHNVKAGNPLFETGLFYATQGALALGINFGPYLHCHLNGDWGDLCDDDKAANNTAVTEGTRIFSAYNTEVGKIWIITEANRATTTILTPQEY